jgi:adenylyltransferase/sulfurtransferase
MTMTVLPQRGPCYACLHPESPEDEEVVSTERLGVLSTAPLVVAALQATEALKLLTGGSEALPCLVTVDVWTQELSRYEVRRDPACTVCGVGTAGREGRDR